MSILFEAWRRARGKDSRLAETLGAPPVGSATRHALIPWLICFALAAVAVGLAVYLWRTHTPRPATVAATSVAGVAAPVIARPAPPVTAAAKIVATVTQPAPPPTSAPATPPAVVANAGPGVTATAHEASATPAVGLAPQQAEASSAPMPIGTAPEDVREALPQFAVTVHVWNEDPAERFVMVGGRIYRPGDELASGVKLVEITRRGEVVGFRGYRIELPGS